MLFRPLVQARADGTFRLNLGVVERRVVADTCAELLEALAEPDAPDLPALERLFPSAYPDDDAADAFFRQMTVGELLASRRAAIETVERTLASKSISRDELEQWMTALNSVRLALGTVLDVDEVPVDVRALDPDDPATQTRLVYELLGVMLDHVVEALSTTLPPPSATYTDE